jgi:hypothetical protein
MNTGVAMTKIDTAVVADTAFASLVPHDAEFSPEKQRLRSEVYALERYLAETQQATFSRMGPSHSIYM